MKTQIISMAAVAILVFTGCSKSITDIENTGSEESRLSMMSTQSEGITINKKIYVGNISYATNEADLYDIFSSYGNVKSVKVIKDQFTGRSKG